MRLIFLGELNTSVCNTDMHTYTQIILKNKQTNKTMEV